MSNDENCSNSSISNTKSECSSSSNNTLCSSLSSSTTTASEAKITGTGSTTDRKKSSIINNSNKSNSTSFNNSNENKSKINSGNNSGTGDECGGNANNNKNNNGNMNSNNVQVTSSSSSLSSSVSSSSNGYGGGNNGNNGNNNINGCNNGNNSNNNNTNNNNNNNGTTNSKNRICRDFVRGLCRRKHCRYPHVLSPDLVVFCHDFQNASCPRVNCKFLHYTLQEEEYYRKYGEFPQDFLGDAGIPCKERIMSGSCRHRECYLTTNEPMWNGPRPPPYRPNDCPPSINDYRSQCEEFQAIKRSSRDVIDSVPFKRFREEMERIDIMAVIRRFEEEQIMLRRRVEANEIKIAELRASNEYLIAQNTQLRLNNVQHQQQQQCSNVVNPVTVTQTTSQQPPPQQQAPPPPPQVMGGVSIAPVQVQATPIVSIAAPPTHQIIANATATPLAIAANTSQGQQLAIAQQNITSLSNTSQTLAPTHAQQILGTSQITLAPAAIAQGPSMGLTINTSQALAISNATQPIISYPVMTHSILPH